MDRKFKIGYIDEESTWIDTFQRNLSEQFDIVIFNLDNETTIDNLISEIRVNNLDCLVVDYELRESSLVTFNGDDIIDRVREVNPDFPVLIITGHDEDQVVPYVEDTDIVRTKDELAENPELFIQRLTGKILLYQNKVKDINEEIELLSAKKVEKGLDLPEEDQLNSLYNQLDKMNPDESILPAVLYERSNIRLISDLVKETQELIEVIKKKKDI